MIVMVSKKVGGGTLVVVGLPKRSQEYLRKGQPAMVEGSLLARSPHAVGVALVDTDIAVAFGNSDEEIRAQLGEHVRGALNDVPPIDRAEDLAELLRGFYHELPKESEARGHVAAAIGSLEHAHGELMVEHAHRVRGSG